MFRSRCDTEVLPHLYERYGSRFPPQLRGCSGSRSGTSDGGGPSLARTARHQAPVLRPRDDLLVFASELKSLLASGLVDPALDYEAIDAFLTFGYMPGPRTPLAGSRS